MDLAPLSVLETRPARYRPRAIDPRGCRMRNRSAGLHLCRAAFILFACNSPLVNPGISTTTPDDTPRPAT